MFWNALKEARTQKSTLATIWLDIANVYGSIPHKVIVFGLRRYGVSPQWIRLAENYCKGIFSRSFSESATSAWHRHHRGIFTDCTLSIILFLADMNILNTLCKSKFLDSPLITRNCLFYILSRMTKVQHLLQFRCTTALTQAGLEFRAENSCSVVIIKGRSINATPLSVSKVADQQIFHSLYPF